MHRKLAPAVGEYRIVLRYNQPAYGEGTKAMRFKLIRSYSFQISLAAKPAASPEISIRAIEILNCT